jgi:hypothetical protein
LIVGAKIKSGPQRQREIGAVGRDAVAGEHPAYGHRAEVGKQVDQEIAVHVATTYTVIPMCPPAPFAAPRRMVWDMWPFFETPRKSAVPQG